MYLIILNPAEELKDLEVDEAVEFHYLRELGINYFNYSKKII
jgi:hypothetical protein